MIQFVAANAEQFFHCLCLSEGVGWAKGDDRSPAVLYPMVVWVGKELKDKLVFRFGKASKIGNHSRGKCFELIDKSGAIKMDFPMKPGMELAGSNPVGFTE